MTTVSAMRNQAREGNYDTSGRDNAGNSSMWYRISSLDWACKAAYLLGLSIAAQCPY
jgi:hypothetical protein